AADALCAPRRPLRRLSALAVGVGPQRGRRAGGLQPRRPRASAGLGRAPAGRFGRSRLARRRRLLPSVRVVADPRRPAAARPPRFHPRVHQPEPRAREAAGLMAHAPNWQAIPLAPGDLQPAWPLPTVTPKFSTTSFAGGRPFGCAAGECERWHAGIDLTSAPN